MLTVDVEPDWGVSGTRAVQEVVPRLCELFEKYGVRGTFFVVADLLDSCGKALEAMARTHEVGSHGLTHRLLDGLREDEVTLELGVSRRRLRDALGQEVAGFRAPFLRTPRGWFEKLAAAGYGYDSSVGCVAPSLRGIRPGRWKVETHCGVAEIPTTTLRTGVVPFSLTYLRLLWPLGEGLISPDARIMYLHPHELADRRLAGVLGLPLRWLLRVGAGTRAWRIMERLVARVAHRAVTCSEFLTQWRSDEPKGE